ncbi:hypothetical protein GCM10027418_06770 [Mariniluteicoccus endophyticus]
MARIPTPQELVDIARATGLPVYEPEGWQRRCRCCPDTQPHDPDGPFIRGFGPWHGVTVHHTAGKTLTGRAAEAYCSAGGWLTVGPDTAPGPLCHYAIDGDGRILMVGAGRCNHAGACSSKAVDMMKAAAFSLDGSQNVRGQAVDANAVTVGIEIMAEGEPSAVQRASAVKLCAALARARGWTGQEVHGHGEISDSRRFDDPGLDMGRFRRDVMAAVKGDVPRPPAHTQEVTVETPVGRIGERWLELGGVASPLGVPTGPEVKTSRGAYTPFERGVMIWSQKTDAHPNYGRIREAFARHGFEGGHLGYPTSPEVPIKGGGRVQRFECGLIYWSGRADIAYAVYGAIEQAYARLGWENGPLGYPTSDEFGTKGGRVQRFEGGTVYWSPTTGAWPVWGLILDQYARDGWENGRWGYPNGPERKTPNGWAQPFQGGLMEIAPPPPAPAASKYRRPIDDPRRFPITCPYGKPGSTWAAGFHPGVDIGCPVGTPVRAVAAGNIRTEARGGWGPAYGTQVIISDDEPGDAGSDWMYAHLSRVTVREGQHVEAGEIIGYSGDTGHTFGPHLHVERRPRGGAYGTFRNPNVWP